MGKKTCYIGSHSCKAPGEKRYLAIVNTGMGLELTPIYTGLNPNQRGSLILAPHLTANVYNSNAKNTERS